MPEILPIDIDMTSFERKRLKSMQILDIFLAGSSSDEDLSELFDEDFDVILLRPTLTTLDLVDEILLLDVSRLSRLSDLSFSVDNSTPSIVSGFVSWRSFERCSKVRTKGEDGFVSFLFINEFYSY